MEKRELEEIRSIEDREARMTEVFTDNGPVEAMAGRGSVEPITSLPIESREQEVQQRLLNRAEEIPLEAGQAVLFHETHEKRADSIVSEGFGDPFDYIADDNYHTPGTVRRGKVFLWPHSDSIGVHDINGIAVLCRVEIDEVLVSSYLSFSALASEELYESKREMGFHHDRMPPVEYNEYHVFSYREYLRWISSGGSDEHSEETLLSFNLG